MMPTTAVTNSLILLLSIVVVPSSVDAAATDEQAAQLVKEVHDKGWIIYSAVTEGGTHDLFLMRPDGSDARQITNTTDYHELAPRFSPDGKKLLYRRISKAWEFTHDKWGFMGHLMLANSDGSEPAALGQEGDFPWASWGPDGKRISCLTRKGIQIVDLATKSVVRELKRNGIYQQLFWSPDGKWFCGVTNAFGEMWTVARMNAETGELNPVNKFQNCTPDWFPDSQRIIFSSRPGNQEGYGFTQLWMADGEGKAPKLVYGEDGRHIYGGLVSPDGKYVLFTQAPKDGLGGPMGIIRLADAPTIRGESKALRALHPNTKDGPVLMLPDGWEPHWTPVNVGGAK